VGESVEIRAMKSVRSHYERDGRAITDVSHAIGKHAGYDLIATKDSRELKLEVKGSAKPYHGIPDLYETQVDEYNKLRADFLCVAYFPPGKRERLAIISREDVLIDPKPKISYSITNECKKEETIKKFLVP
jgi:hypothetical protein